MTRREIHQRGGPVVDDVRGAEERMGAEAAR
jgi:hypothetical protein